MSFKFLTLSLVNFIGKFVSLLTIFYNLFIYVNVAIKIHTKPIFI